MAKTTRKPVAEWNPETNYRWEPNDVFEINGSQLAALYHMLNKELNEPGGAPLIHKVHANDVIIEIFKAGVASGVIKEAAQVEEDPQVEAKLAKMFK